MASKPKPHHRPPSRSGSTGRDPTKPTASAPRWTLAILLVGVAVCLALGVWRWGLRSPESRMPLTPVHPPSHDAARSVQSPEEERSAACVAQANQLLRQGKVAEALTLYREAEKLTPGDEDVHYNLGIALARLGQTNEAVAAYQTALRLFPEYAEAHNNLGNLLVRCGRVDEGLAHFRAALRALPDYASAHNNLGNALRLAGQAEAARRAFARAVELDPNYWEARFNLASAYREENRLSEAAAEYRQVLELRPGFVPAREALAQLEPRLAPPPPPLAPGPGGLNETPARPETPR